MTSQRTTPRRNGRGRGPNTNARPQPYDTRARRQGTSATSPILIDDDNGHALGSNANTRGGRQGTAATAPPRTNNANVRGRGSNTNTRPQPSDSLARRQGTSATAPILIDDANGQALGSNTNTRGGRQGTGAAAPAQPNDANSRGLGSNTNARPQPSDPRVKRQATGTTAPTRTDDANGQRFAARIAADAARIAAARATVRQAVDDINGHIDRNMFFRIRANRRVATARASTPPADRNNPNAESRLGQTLFEMEIQHREILTLDRELRQLLATVTRLAAQIERLHTQAQGIVATPILTERMMLDVRYGVDRAEFLAVNIPHHTAQAVAAGTDTRDATRAIRLLYNQIIYMEQDGDTPPGSAGGGSGPGNNCMICLSTLDQRTARQAWRCPRGHWAHLVCIVHYLRTRREQRLAQTCPSCPRSALPSPAALGPGH